MKVLRILLTIGFGWLGIKGIEILARSSSADRLIFVGAGFGWLFWILVPCIVALLVAAVWYLWRPSKTGYRIAQIALLMHFAHTLLGTLLSFLNPELFREAVIASRTARGLAVRPELLKMIESPGIKVFMVALMAMITLVALVMLYYFEKWQRAIRDGAKKT